MTLPNAPLLPPDVLADLTALRHALHRVPELSGRESATAATIAEALRALSPDRLITGLGGHGVAAQFGCGEPSVMLRAELDALPITETGTPDWRSVTPGKGHLCGHDGHMAMLMGAAHHFAANRPAQGRVVVLFQPAEETGAGAVAVLADPDFAALACDWAFAIHNMPGIAQGHAAVRAAVMNCASRGLRLRLEGRTAHASDPASGVSPAPALAALIPGLAALSQDMPRPAPGFRLVTITHARLGEAAFGIAPGEAELWATLRSYHDDDMTALADQALALAQDQAARHGLRLTADWHDIFTHCENDAQAAAIMADAARTSGLSVTPGDLPMRASEDFGRFAQVSKTAMLLLGAGGGPALHNPDYDFPDALIEPGASILIRAASHALTT
ncbi:MAG: amidohydrolase [Paracoccus sp. (in: a-proteobacteria)]|uniref:amidohydrolase n=1 Tax=Paracoccus sp. TaxID=267 RepID=UPI0026E018DC|nr:amidohydrolase [Paracoccus sp. (in: a-proteobacteria)]MDO5620405.1 amidohydrolase [Paracoccus sp. (in: a-proteobacteria)]